MKRNNKKREYRPHSWQLDPNALCTKSNEVQYWHNGLMVTGQMPKAKAQALVANGEAFVISEQAVGAMVDGVSAA